MAVPLTVRRFESLSLGSIIVGLIHAFAASEDGHLDIIITAVVMGALVLLASRRRKNWARWALLISFASGCALMVSQPAAMFSNGYPLITAALTLLHAVAIILLFTPQSAAWFRGVQPQP